MTTPVLFLAESSETVGKPCANCEGVDPATCLFRCERGVVRERYVVAKARRECRMKGAEAWTECCEPRPTHDLLFDHRVVPVEPLGETDWYIATKQSVAVAVSLSDYLSGEPTPSFESRFAITHVAHNVRELPVVAYEEMEPPDSYLRPYRDGSLVAIGGDRSGPTDITDEPWASDLAPGDLVLELTEPPVLLDEPIVEMKRAGYFNEAHTWIADRVVPLALALGVNRIELP